MYLIDKIDNEFVLCELIEKDRVIIPYLAHSESIEQLQEECDLIFGKNAINCKELKTLDKVKANE